VPVPFFEDIMVNNPESNQLHEAQRKRLEQFNVPRCVDIHCHCLPGVDDGPATMSEAVSLCRMIVEDGITTVIATPHQLGRYDRHNSGAKVRQLVEELSAELAKESIPLEIHPGADVRVDERILTLLDKDEVLTLAHGKQYLLLELPHELFIDPRPLLDTLVRRGIRPIVSHPERHRYLRHSPDSIRSWLSHGAILQITGGSLTGDFGPRAFEMAWNLIRDGSAAVVATDAHDTEVRCPCLSAAIDAISTHVNPNVARRLCITNPLRILEGRQVKTIAAM